MTLNDATARQVAAADPGKSSWVSANAGSGKTRVLTDRVARMLYQNVSPSRVLCLTYTKAAASEMQNRLFETLGGWAMASDEHLAQELTRLGETGPFSQEQLRHARQMFAVAIETPGGLKIQTIHAFCSAVLRRFPLEAGVTPNFREIDDRAAADLRAAVLDELAEADATALSGLAQHLPVDVSEVAAQVARGDGAMYIADPDSLWSAFDLPPGYDQGQLWGAYAIGGEEAQAIQAYATAPFANVGDAKQAAKLAGLVGRDLRIDDIPLLESVFLFGEKAAEPFGAKIGKVPAKKAGDLISNHVPALNDLMEKLERLRPIRVSLLAAQRTLALSRFATAFRARYTAHKTARGLLDFDDLISGALNLLSKGDAAQWVLYRLDGGIDHILVDEAQDTSPDQWRIVESLSQEFTSGDGARSDIERTIFVVGDQKQSIYSFQGAAPEAFETMRARFDRRLHDGGQALQSVELSHSFRSAPAILKFVDETLAEHRNDGLGGQVHHLAFHEKRPGRVDLWPWYEQDEDAQPKRAFSEPLDALAPNDPKRLLAEQIAEMVHTTLQEKTAIWGDKGPRSVRPGDFLILVRKRSGSLFPEILRALKARKLPVAGSDVINLGDELAVKDLRSLLAFLATPADSLSLAEALRSPLLGWSEADLYAIAQPREGPETLWQSMQRRRAKDDPTRRLLHELLALVDQLSPFELLDRILTRHGGRQKLIGRLGPECEEGVDALLARALDYEQREVASLVGFVSWLGDLDDRVKRLTDGEGDLIRVMTAHGAKGLEAPIVILPDTGSSRSGSNSDKILTDDDGAIWKPLAEEMDPRSTAAAAAEAEAERQERMRLFYVAMTRAESWLILCGAGKQNDDTWYSIAERGMAKLNHQRAPHPLGVMRRFATGIWPEGAPPDAPKENDKTKLPDWIDEHAHAPARAPRLLSPSDLGGSKVLVSDASRDGATAARHGSAVHKLLEILPGVPQSNWHTVAVSHLGDDRGTADALAEASAVILDPGLAHIFAAETLAEVPIVAALDELGGRKIFGTIDRLLVGSTSVTIIDFKTNAVVPAQADETPEGILRQLGAYRAAVSQIFPEKQVNCAILWTSTRSLMSVGEDIVSAALARTPTP